MIQKKKKHFDFIFKTRTIIITKTILSNNKNTLFQKKKLIYY